MNCLEICNDGCSFACLACSTHFKTDSPREYCVCACVWAWECVFVSVWVPTQCRAITKLSSPRSIYSKNLPQRHRWRRYASIIKPSLSLSRSYTHTVVYFPSFSVFSCYLYCFNYYFLLPRTEDRCVLLSKSRYITPTNKKRVCLCCCLAHYGMLGISQ